MDLHSALYHIITFTYILYIYGVLFSCTLCCLLCLVAEVHCYVYVAAVLTQEGFTGLQLLKKSAFIVGLCTL